MAITSIRPARYGIGERVSFVSRGTTRTGIIVGREDATHRRGYRPGWLYLLRCDVDSELLDVIESDIGERMVAEESAA